ncbi:MAG: MoaD/ThiS family protein [Dehalococcoidales bacterium]|jgi:molybdopterin converting factor small subunit|nr:MoaD/ThiS family protein [Dehalococcoidales bacterium]
MFKCRLEMYGLPPEITTLRAVELELRDGATMAEVIAALKEKIPSLEGSVIRRGENRLEDLYKFNVNGHFYFDGMDFQLHQGDRIALLVPATGG